LAYLSQPGVKRLKLESGGKFIDSAVLNC